MGNVTLLLTKPPGEVARLSLELSDTPLAKAVVAALQQPGLEALQVRWSGDGTYITLGDGFTPPDDLEEDDTASEFERGDVVVFVGGGKLILAYDYVRTYERDDELLCHQIGTVAESDLDTLREVGNNIHRDGSRTVSLA